MRIPPSFFGIAFGLAGLSEVWTAAGELISVPAAVPVAIAVLAAVSWLVLLAAYLSQGPARIAADLRDPVLAPFVPLAVITPMILAAELVKVAPAAGRAGVVVFLVATIGLGGWMTGQWIISDLPRDACHPGYFLPTVAGGLIGADAAAIAGLHAVAEASFGIGIACWLLLGSAILGRLFFRPALPPALVPTLAVEVAPPVVAGIAYFQLSRGALDGFSLALGGYAVLMVLVQLRFVPVYWKLKFTPGFWAFTFSYCAVAVDGLAWLRLTRPAGATGYAIVIAAAITLLIAAIAARTLIAIGQGKFLPAAKPLQEVRGAVADAA